MSLAWNREMVNNGEILKRLIQLTQQGKVLWAKDVSISGEIEYFTGICGFLTIFLTSYTIGPTITLEVNGQMIVQHCLYHPSRLGDLAEKLLDTTKFYIKFSMLHDPNPRRVILNLLRAYESR